MQVYAKPKYSYVYLIALAINNNMEKQMSLKDIYEYIMENYPFYRHPESGGGKLLLDIPSAQMTVLSEKR